MSHYVIIHFLDAIKLLFSILLLPHILFQNLYKSLQIILYCIPNSLEEEPYFGLSLLSQVNDTWSIRTPRKEYWTNTEWIFTSGDTYHYDFFSQHKIICLNAWLSLCFTHKYLISICVHSHNEFSGCFKCLHIYCTDGVVLAQCQLQSSFQNEHQK